MKYSSADDEAEVLPNLLGLSSLEEVQQAETEGFLLAEQSLLNELREDEVFDVAYIKEIHRRALGQVYGFAGRYRTVNLSKGSFTFPAAQHLPQSMADFERSMLRTLPHIWPDADSLVYDVARVHAELLFIHPFRDGATAAPPACWPTSWPTKTARPASSGKHWPSRNVLTCMCGPYKPLAGSTTSQ